MASPRSHDDNDDSSLPNLSMASPDALRPFSRSPHPYHRTSISRTAGASTSIDNPSAATSAATAQTDRLHPTPPPAWSKTPSDSGTEADDESTGILKGLPAPPSRSRKGLSRAEDSTDPWVPALLPWPALARSRARELSRGASGGDGTTTTTIGSVTSGTDRLSQEKRVEILRRLLEVALLVSVGVVVVRPADVREIAWVWRKELIAHSLLVTGLYVAYPFCVSTRWPRARLFKLPAFTIPMSFDPAPLLYPIAIPVFVALSLTKRRPTLVLPNIVLGLSSLPTPVIPLQGWVHGYSVMHWMVTLIPILVAEYLSWGSAEPKPLSLYGIDSEALTLVFPLQQALIPILDFLLATSLLPAELQLLASALINLFLFASSPQAKILKAMLWLGGLCIFVLCRHVLRWEVALARIPSWRFRRFPTSSQSRRTLVNDIDHTICKKLSRIGEVDLAALDSDVDEDPPPLISSRRTVQESQDLNMPGELASAVDKVPTGESVALPRRNTISTLEEVQPAQVRTTSKGRRKRLMAPELASLLSMTVPQAQVRKWLYALYVYVAILAIALGPVRKYVGDQALDGQEPFGWALGYLFGNLPMFRFWVVMMNLERWIHLPARLDDDPSCVLGSIEHLRQDTFGEANTRLLICAYCFTVLLTGMAVVLKLSSIAQVDTRRKVFHGMMVLMFLPTIFVDPAFSALALGTVLSIFLLLDLFRASQLPPISRPLTYFLTPYVDGRDHRGPVIVSHIFLLIGCSIPLWLSLADVPRNTTDEGPWNGWNVLSRETSMVSGVICVGMGDAAASLIGRRFGRLKWFWGGGKSLEGSVAFALAVFVGLILGRGWLVIGRWPVSGENASDPLAHGDMVAWGWLMVRAMLAAGGTSATEAILTGCNDNVAVPVVLWLLVKGMGV